MTALAGARTRFYPTSVEQAASDSSRLLKPMSNITDTAISHTLHPTAHAVSHAAVLPNRFHQLFSMPPQDIFETCRCVVSLLARDTKRDPA